MTFKHRLSRRLAVLRSGLALLLTLGLSACMAEDQLPLGPDDPGTTPSDDLTFEVLPPSMVLEVGQQARIRGLDLSRAGDTVATEVDWSVSGGTITADGLFSAYRAGTYWIVGKRRKNRPGSNSDTSIVVVVPTAPDLKEIIISPASAALLTGDSKTFSAVGRLSDSSTTQIAVAWSATGGQIDGNGVYRAGNTAGQFRVVATNTAGTVADTALVDVSAPPEPTLAQVILTPATASVVVGGTVQLKAYGKDSAGDSVAVSATYTASGGTVNGSGLYTAGNTAGTYRAIAASNGFADTSVITVTAAPPPPAPVVTRVVLTPASATLTTGGTQKFFAYGRTDAGDSVAVTVAYTATGGTISSSGQYTAGSTAGSYRVIAASGALADTSAVTLNAPATPPPPTSHAGYHVTPSGSSSGDGSASRPWDLASVLAGSRGVRAGDTVWVHGGTYRIGELVSYVAGSSGGQVVIRQYPGERAVLDGNMVISGAGYVSFWGLEVMNSNPVGTGKMGINVRAPNVKLINLVVHDAGMSGIGTWMESPNSEIYGSIIYNNGTHANLDHGIYAQNSSGTKLMRDNVLFNNLAYGFHLYTSDGQYNRNVTLEGNVSFNNGSIGNDTWRPDFFVGGSTPASGIVARGNFSYRSDRRETGDWGWYYGAINQDLTLVDNYFVGTLHVDRWQTVNQSNNAVISTSSSATKVVVRPNVYEPGRANVVVYNWGRQGSVSADLSGIMAPGTAYEVRSVQQFTGAPVAQGTYAGGAISIPVNRLTPTAPIGRSTQAAPVTSPEFDVFVVLPKP